MNTRRQYSQSAMCMNTSRAITSSRRAERRQQKQSRARTVVAVVSGLLSRIWQGGVDLLPLFAGRGLLGQTARVLTPREWLVRFCGNAELAFPAKRGANVMCDTYQRAQRQRALQRKCVGPNYNRLRKQSKLDEKHFQYRPEYARIEARDAVSGVVS